MRATRTTTALLLASALLAGCEHDPLSVSPGDGPSQAAAAQDPAQDLDSEFVRRAREIPGFGGYYFDESGDLVVVLTDLRQEAAARASLASVLRGHRSDPRLGRNGAGEMRVHRGDYDFIQLNDWRGRARNVLSIPGTVFLDTDEVSNRLRIGVEDLSLAPKVEAELARRAVPRAAVLIEKTSPVRFVTTLNDYIRPVDGGLLIDYNTSWCTLGVNVYYSNPYWGASSTPSFMTASHCTNVQGGIQNPSTYSQGGAAIGTEYVDPEYSTSATDPYCPPGRRCRHSDVALGRYNAQTTFNLGGIARTTYSGNTTRGSTDIDPSNPRFWIVAGYNYPTVGQYLNKVGATSGWTWGRVSSTCVDYNVGFSDVTLYCQHRADGRAEGGDSGSPVFEWPTGTSSVYFAGILWGADIGVAPQFFVFSSPGNISTDLGSGVSYF